MKYFMVDSVYESKDKVFKGILGFLVLFWFILWFHVDINECEIDRFICGFTGVCINNEGSYECQCPPGEAMIGTVCIGKIENVLWSYDTSWSHHFLIRSFYGSLSFCFELWFH